MHFDWTISIGSCALFVTMLGVGFRFERLMYWVLMEHEILIRDYCERHDLKVTEMPTRLKPSYFSFLK
jgi:hypothetical protein